MIPNLLPLNLQNTQVGNDPLPCTKKDGTNSYSENSIVSYLHNTKFSIIGPPDLVQLKRLNIPTRVGTNYSNFGTFLLDDKDGAKVSTLKFQNFHVPNAIVEGILNEWLTLSPTPCTWEKLIEVLMDCQLRPLAADVRKYVASGQI